MFGTGTLALVFGTGCAWLVTLYRFPGRAWLEWLLVLSRALTRSRPGAVHPPA